MTAVCSSCQAPIVFALGTSGGKIPLDPEPVPNGNLLAVDDHGEILPTDVALDAVLRGRGRVVVARRAHRTMDPTVPRWRSHFATCSNPERHRRRGTARTTIKATQDTLPL